jgi:hypothetical protein
MAQRIWYGLAAGAAGTTALNAVTYLDMAVRGRPASSTPEQTVRMIEDATHLSLSQDGPDSDAAGNRRGGIAALMGIATGLTSGVAYALLRPHARAVPLPVAGLVAGMAANAGTVLPMAASGVSDPRTWTPSSWLSDIVPHIAFGMVTAAVFDALDRPSTPSRLAAALRRVTAIAGR